MIFGPNPILPRWNLCSMAQAQLEVPRNSITPCSSTTIERGERRTMNFLRKFASMICLLGVATTLGPQLAAQQSSQEAAPAQQPAAPAQSESKTAPAAPADTASKPNADRSEEHTSELQSRGLISYAVFCLKKK